MPYQLGGLPVPERQPRPVQPGPEPAPGVPWPARKIAWGLAALVLALGGLGLWWLNNRAAQPDTGGPQGPLATVRTVTATQGGVESTLRLTGVTAAERYVSLNAPQLAGRRQAACRSASTAPATRLPSRFRSPASAEAVVRADRPPVAAVQRRAVAATVPVARPHPRRRPPPRHPPPPRPVARSGPPLLFILRFNQPVWQHPVGGHGVAEFGGGPNHRDRFGRHGFLGTGLDLDLRRPRRRRWWWWRLRLDDGAPGTDRFGRPRPQRRRGGILRSPVYAHASGRLPRHGHPGRGEFPHLEG